MTAGTRVGIVRSWLRNNQRNGVLHPMMRNGILSQLSPEDGAALLPYLSQTELPARTVLQTAGAPLGYVHFLESGLASLVAVARHERIEVALVGREGLTGFAGVLGQPLSLHDAVMQVDGSGYRMSVADLRRCMCSSPALAATLMRYVHVVISQVSQTALANGRQTVEQRLARWLLMAQDRLDGPVISLTHERLASILGVRRPGVTVALHMLEGVHAIRSRRNAITILDRDRLIGIAGATYGETEALYDRLFRPVSLAA